MQGAEAIVYEEEGNIIKERTEKPYRIKELDDKLRKSRTTREAGILEKVEFSPKLIRKDKYRIVMEKLDGHLVKDIFDKDHERISKLIGKTLTELHEKHIIHGDLTTSNMILNEKLFLIDFGLSSYSHKEEDKAVDLHLLKRAIDSKHHENAEESMRIILENYNPENRESILKRLDKVEMRGRNKKKS
ncbi:MAG: KEOPS complex kinase/ATPase Bud32 [Nanobdellota archaeon]